MNSSLFITGTNTKVGKTFISALLMLAAHSANINTRYFKPIQTGDDSDCDTVKSLTGLTEDKIVRPVISFSLPAAPYRAALAENKSINISLITERWLQLRDLSVIVEGAGGILVPIKQNYLIKDLIKTLQLKLIIVASTALGTINHTLLTIEAAQKAGIPIVGIILSGEHDPGLVETLTTFSAIPILAEVPWLHYSSTSDLREQSVKFFNPHIIQELFTC